MSKDLYNTQAKRLDTIIGSSKTIWIQIVSAKKEFDLLQIYQQIDFYKWLQDTYGVKLQLTPDGEMSLANEILDEQKYLIFMLKHSGE
jgi:predicted 3-demethylubiquinone-9 3-methyltransferase (glyoxalase superfamily)